MAVRHNAIDFLHRHFPALEFREARIVQDGWDVRLGDDFRRRVYPLPRSEERDRSEVVYGLETEQRRLVTSGLEGIRSRLPSGP